MAVIDRSGIAMAGTIFINYRRSDDPGNAGRLFDCLQEVFPRGRLFIDVDSIEPGVDFVEVLREQVAQCDVLISIIGRGWVDARDETGARRLDNPADFVRIEIEAALAQGKRLIPVLVGEARMPRADELPDAMKPLARRNAVRLTHERFRPDTQGLIGALKRALESAENVRKAEEAARRAEAERQANENRHVALRDQSFWAAGNAPSWADDWGHDEHGPWVSFRVPTTEVTQRIRWLPPGELEMGFSTFQLGMDRNEGPGYSVTFAHGFWIFETACTRALWAAVRAEPQPELLEAASPITGVSWNDAQAFVQRLNAMLPGLAVSLPSETKWEYADQPHMCSNVWEWCEDTDDDYDCLIRAADHDGSAWLRGDPSQRVIRLGYWIDRRSMNPTNRDDSVGFRCVSAAVAPADAAKIGDRG
jgi:formylglycine-generating enzyme required for sulfatase activity